MSRFLFLNAKTQPWENCTLTTAFVCTTAPLQVTASSSSSSAAAASGTITKFVVSGKKSVDITRHYARFMARSDVSARMVESGPFRQFMTDVLGAAGCVAVCPSRITVGRWAKKVALEDFSEVKGVITTVRDQGGKFAITADYGSTKGTMKPLLGATTTWIAADWSGMYTAAIGAKYSPGRHPSEKVRREIIGIMGRVGLGPEHGTSFTHDGGSNMQDVDLGNNSLLDIPCDAHKMANIPKHVLKMEPPRGVRSFKDMFNNLHYLVVTIRASPLRREHFLELQEGRTDSAGRSLRPRMLALGPDHKFIYVDIEVNSVVELADVIAKVREWWVHEGGRTCAGQAAGAGCVAWGQGV